MNFLRIQPAGQGLPVPRLLDRIRRLVRLADERDLRQLPAAAQGIDAVRLMTMHGEQGLEFPVVHIPGLKRRPCPRSPDARWRGIVSARRHDRGRRRKSLDAMQGSPSEEQECLFFVALSRARDRLFLYSPDQDLNGSNPRSPFVLRLTGSESASQPGHVPTLSAPAS